jgi:alpha-D-ribose 1-methylphosphonate 5-triphosphate synthase subunit PhnI
MLAIAGATVARTPTAVGVDELRTGIVEVVFLIPELGAEVSIADIVVSECVTWAVAREGTSFRNGYGLCLGSSDRRAMAVAMLDLEEVEVQESQDASRLSGDFLLSHCDALQTAGYVEHLRMPQYVSFQTLMAARALRAAGAQ